MQRVAFFFRDWIPGLWNFIRHIPGYWRLETKEQGYEPEAYNFIIHQYERILTYITKGRMSKPTYFAKDVIQLMNDVFCEYCEYKDWCKEAESDGN